MRDIEYAVRLEVPDKVPVFALGGLFNVRMCGISYSEYTHGLEKMVKCEIEAVKRFDYDWVYLNPDDYVEFEPLGIETKGEDNVPRTASEYLPASWTTLEKLGLPNPYADGRMPSFLRALTRIKNELGDSICLTGRVAAPFSSVALLYGIKAAMVLLFRNRELFRETADYFVQLQIEWGKAQIQAGSDAIWLGDCVASSKFISPSQYAQFAAGPALKVSDALKKEGAYVFYHACEDSLPHLELMADLHPSALSIGGGIDIEKAKETVGKRICLLGNIDPIDVLQFGNAEMVERETRRIMEIGKKNGGYIFNSEEGFPYDVPERNVMVMMQTAKKHCLCERRGCLR